MKKHKHRFKLNIHSYFTLVIMVIFTLVLFLGSALTYLLEWLFGPSYELPVVVRVFVFGLIFGSIITSALSKAFLAPVTTLSEAMKRVAEGDFTVTLDEKSKIREIRESYESFNMMVRELASTEELQTDFVSNVSHEFKTPINAIEGYAMLLQENTLDPKEQEEYITNILMNTRRLSKLAGNILLLSKIENQSIQAKKETFRLDEQIRQAIVSLESQWGQKEIEFDVNMQSVQYYGNESLLMHVWMNLIGNAIKFDPPQGFLEIRLQADETTIVCTIRDSGPGIAEDQKDRIFEKFYQADSSHTDEGNGLGLALVKRILDINQGTIAVQNAAEGGCQFTVCLPASKKENR